MSAPVDVLAVLDAAHATFDNLRYERRNNDDALRQSMHWSARIEEMIKARAAIAELIEAVKEYDAAEEELEAITPDMPEDEFLRINDRLRIATYRRAAALAAVSPK